MNHFVRITVSLFPVLALAVGLLYLDRYKLVKLRSVAETILFGALVAVACILLKSLFLTDITLEGAVFSMHLISMYLSPILEELFKGIYLVYLVKTRRIGFIVDGAIFGFAIGAGFGAAENIYYLYSLPDENLLTWCVRGFGTAILHGGTTAIMGIISKYLCERHGHEKTVLFFPGLGIAFLIHSFFNHFFIPNVISALGIWVFFPLLILFSFERSEKSLKTWLSEGLDSDIEIFEMIRSGKVLESRMGRYFNSLKNRIPGEILTDMLCYVRIFTELSIKAKGILMMREHGFQVSIDPETEDKFVELEHLEKNIGKIGKRYLSPFLHAKSHDLWQLHMLERE